MIVKNVPFDSKIIEHSKSTNINLNATSSNTPNTYNYNRKIYL